MLAFAAVVAALCSHFAIDVLGDFLVRHDSYDDVSHASRRLGAIAAGVCLFVSLGFALRAALATAHGNEGALVIALRRATPRSCVLHWAQVTIVSAIVVAAMEACDSASAGLPCDDIVDLFGGSLLLAATVTSCVAAIVCAFVRAALRRITQLHREIARIVVAFVRCVRNRQACSAFAVRTLPRTFAPFTVLSRGGGDRAPPPFPSLVFL